MGTDKNAEHGAKLDAKQDTLKSPIRERDYMPGTRGHGTRLTRALFSDDRIRAKENL